MVINLWAFELMWTGVPIMPRGRSFSDRRHVNFSIRKNCPFHNILATKSAMTVIGRVLTAIHHVYIYISSAIYTFFSLEPLYNFLGVACIFFIFSVYVWVANIVYYLLLILLFTLLTTQTYTEKINKYKAHLKSYAWVLKMKNRLDLAPNVKCIV